MQINDVDKSGCETTANHHLNYNDDDDDDGVGETNTSHDVPKIAMLTDFVENSRQKCAQYFPKYENDFLIFSSNQQSLPPPPSSSSHQNHHHHLFNLPTTQSSPNVFHRKTVSVQQTPEDGCYGDHDIDDMRRQQTQSKSFNSSSSNNLDELNSINRIDDSFIKNFRNLKFNFNFFIVKNVSVVERNGYTIRKLLVLYYDCNQGGGGGVGDDEAMAVGRRDNNNKFYVYHYWFPDWPDHRSPDDIDVLLDMSLDLLGGGFNEKTDLLTTKKQNATTTDNNVVGTTTTTMPSVFFEPNLDGPLPVIHCSAGIGRTGCLAAILNGLRQIRLSIAASEAADNTVDGGDDDGSSRNKINLKNLNVDVLGIVCNLRLQRGGMVQNSEQYELIHRALCLYQDRLVKSTLN